MAKPQAIINGLIARFADSGHTEMETVAQLCRDHLVNERFSKGRLDQDSLVLLDSILAEVITAARTVRTALHTACRWPEVTRERITLSCAYATGQTMPAFLEIGPTCVTVGFAGYGDCNTEPDSAVVLVEQVEGRPQVLVYGDINREEPTHKIDLAGAKQDRRLAEAG